MPEESHRSHKWTLPCRGIFSLLTVLFFLGVCSSCSRNARTIALIPQTTANELWESAHAGAEQAALGSGWKIYWNGPSREDDIESQIRLIQQAIERRYGGLILAPDHSLALTTVVRQATRSGIPVVVLSSPLASAQEENLTYLLNDEEAAGELVAERMGKILEGKGEIAVLGQDPDIIGTVMRGDSMVRTLQSRYPGIHIVARRQGSFRGGQAGQSVEEVLDANPKIQGMFTIGIGTTRAAFIALKSRGLVGRVKLIGSDQDLDLLYYLRRGEIDSIVAQNSFAMGAQAVETIRKSQEKGAAKPPAVMKLKPFLITRDTIDHPEIQKLLSMDWRPRP